MTNDNNKFYIFKTTQFTICAKVIKPPYVIYVLFVLICKAHYTLCYISNAHRFLVMCLGLLLDTCTLSAIL